MRFGTNWSDETQALTREHLGLYARPGGPPLPMKAWDGRFGLLVSDNGMFRISDRESGSVETYASVAALIGSGWAID